MKRRARWEQWIAVAALVACLSAAAAADDAKVVKIVVNDMIHPISEEFIARAIAEAEKQDANLVLIQMSTPGGLADSTRAIVEKILASKVPVAVWVAPSGARAASAGFYILESADVAAMAPGTNTGAATPVLLSGEKVDEKLQAKMEEDSAAFMRAFVGKRGRNVEAAESAVREAKSFTDQEALKANLIDVVAASQEELLEKLNGMTVTRFNGDKEKLATAQASVETLEMTLKQRILSFIMDPNVAFILFALGMLALYAELNNPGAILPGVVGLISILLALFALNILPTSWAAVALILGAFVLFALETQIASHGVLGAGGVILLTLGGLLLVDGPIPEMRVQLLTALSVSIPVALITMFLVGLVIKAQRQKALTGVESMIGEVAVARTPLAPQGKVFINGELWDAVSTSPVSVGGQVQVKNVRGLTLLVEPVGASRTPGHNAAAV